MSVFKASIATAVAQAVRMLSGLVIIKLIAITLGAEGFGRLGHFMSLISILSVIAGGGVLNGIVKYVAEYKNTPVRLHSFLSCAALYSLLFSSVLCFFLIWFAGRISRLLFDSDQFSQLIIFLALIQFGYGLVNFCNGVMNGLTNTAIFAKISVIGSLIGLPISCWLIYRFEFSGAVMGIALINLCLLPPALYEVKKLGFLKKISLRMNRIDAGNIARFSVMQLVSLLTLPIAEIVIRTHIAQYFGWHETGLWQGLMRLSAVYLGFFTMFLAAYYMPVLSGIADRKKSYEYVVKNLLLIGSVFFVIALSIYLMKSYVFLIVFSNEFIIPASYVQYQLMGDFFKILSYVIAFLIVAKASSTLYILGELIQSGLYLGLALFFIETGKMDNVFIAYALSNCLYFCVGVAGLLFYGRGFITRNVA